MKSADVKRERERKTLRRNNTNSKTIKTKAYVHESTLYNRLFHNSRPPKCTFSHDKSYCGHMKNNIP